MKIKKRYLKKNNFNKNINKINNTITILKILIIS